VTVPFPPADVHFSDLKRIGRSPAHYRSGIEHPGKATPAMLFGTLVHAIVLGGRFVVYPGARRGNAWKEYAEEHAGDCIVTQAEYDRAEPCAQAVLDHPVAAPLLEGARLEAFLRWDLGGRKCAGTLDILNPDRHYLADVKTSTCSEPGWFMWQARKMSYHAQLDWYRAGAEKNGHIIRDCYAIVVETKRPWPVTVMRLTDFALELGGRQTRLWLERLDGCVEVGEWPAYVQDVVDLDIEGPADLIGFDDEDDDDA